jgi:hypothetical protein
MEAIGWFASKQASTVAHQAGTARVAFHAAVHEWRPAVGLVRRDQRPLPPQPAAPFSAAQ